MLASMNLPVRPLLRWAGSKRRSLRDLAARCPQQIERYVEPFAGSACLAFAVAASHKTLADLNPAVIEFYRHLRSNPAGLYEAYALIPRAKEEYYRIRTLYNDSPPSLQRSAYFLYLNRYCFNGIYRVNRKGHFNVPWGGDQVGNPLEQGLFHAASAVLADSDLKCGDFEEITLSCAAEGTFVYLDPPFAREERRVFREYDANGFCTKDWQRLVQTLEELDRRGALFLLSYAGDTEAMGSLARWNVGFLDVTRNVGGFTATRRKHREFLASNLKAPLQ